MSFKVNRGKFYVRLAGQSQSTGFFLLKDPVDVNNKKSPKFKIEEMNVDKIQSLNIRYEGSKKDVCKIKSIKVKSNKGHHFV